MGEKALLNYQKICKSGRKKKEKNDFQENTIKSPLLSYLAEVEIQKLPPKAFGFTHRKKRDEIDISSFYLRDSYVDAFSKGIKKSSQV